MTGPQALASYEQAKALVKEGRYDDALAVEMLPSDRAVIEARIAEAKNSTSANRGVEHGTD